MHANKIRPFVRRALLVQMREGVIEYMPGFSVTRVRNPDRRGAGFEIKIEGHMEEDSGHGVDVERLKSELMNRFPSTDFCVLKPF